MTEMVERVCRAVKKRAKEPVGNVPSLSPLLVGSLGGVWPYLIKAALIEMREPTEAMLRIGNIMCGDEFGRQAEDVWRAMIDAALGEGR